MNRIDYRIPLNNIEIWSITNQTMVAHPFHIHDVQFFVVDRDGVIAPPEERGYKDVVMVAPNETVRFITKFEDYADTSMPYMYHCHVLMHEDDGMMGQFIVTPPLGVQNLSVSKESLCVYPNPSTGYFSVAMQSDKQDTGELSLSDMTGKIIFRTFVKLNQGEQLISSPFGMANLPAGVYLVQFTGDQSIRQTKLLIEK
jgi:hypothetical protein